MSATEIIAPPPSTMRPPAPPLAGYGRPEPARVPEAPGDYAGESYYGHPALKPSPFGAMVALYIEIAGLGGAAQIISSLLDLLGPPGSRATVRRGRAIAFAAAPLGAALLVADLHTPQRFYNMLRIFRRTSPMSIGTYALMSFGLFSGLTLAGDIGGAPRLARAAQLPAAVAGAGMTCYTAALLAATSTPLWSAEPQLLAMRFAASSLASGAAALALTDRLAGGATENAVDLVGAAAAAAALASGAESERRYRAKGLDAPLRGPWGPLRKIGAASLAGAAPLAFYALRRRSPGLSIAASLGVIAGGLLMRLALLEAGNRSAQRPQDYFRLTQPKRAAPGDRR